MTAPTTIGVPYARVGFDDDGLFVTCPTCGEKFHGTGSKAATRKYALHFVATHDEATE